MGTTLGWAAWAHITDLILKGEGDCECKLCKAAETLPEEEVDEIDFHEWAKKVDFKFGYVKPAAKD
jgi:hypothetical protein